MTAFFSGRVGSFLSFSILFSLILMLSACQESGPCEWYTSKFHAGISAIEFKEVNANGDSTYRVMLQFDQGTLSREYQDLGELRNVEITQEALVRNTLRVGVSFTGSISDVKSGNCESPIVAFDQKWR
ncbi:hypothetical protein KFE98_03595 [bacterium SCSIO 12741]|nr:hypothetical protein KFE98_03595 [bacterium SCSIO 12741]